MAKVVSRKEAGLRGPRSVSKGDLKGKTTAHWNGPTIRVKGKTTWDHSHCAALLRGIQRFHMDDRKWNDAAYNFAVCPHDVIFELRGLNVINGANGTNAGNRGNHAVLFLAGQENSFSAGEKRAFKRCVRHISENTNAPNSAMNHRDHKSTECPGNARNNWVNQGMPTSGGSSPAPSKPKPSNSSRPTLRRGDSGPYARIVQAIIKNRAGGNIAVDGKFGPHTESRVKDLQRLHGLTPDGVVGPKTWDVLDKINRPDAKPVSKPPANSGKALPMLRRGDTGPYVRVVQTVIDKKAGGNIAVDDNFGPQTENRVRQVQRIFGLPQDGIVGPKTWDVLTFLNRS